MAPKHHPAPLSGGDRKARKKELSKSRAMTRIFAERSAEKRREGNTRLLGVSISGFSAGYPEQIGLAL
jgi:hypothetical protein